MVAFDFDFSAIGAVVFGVAVTALFVSLIASALSPSFGLRPAFFLFAAALVGGALWGGWEILEFYLTMGLMLWIFYEKPHPWGSTLDYPLDYTLRAIGALLDRVQRPARATPHQSRAPDLWRNLANGVVQAGVVILCLLAVSFAVVVWVVVRTT